MNENSIINIMNTIRANASQEYQERVPEATRDNIDEVGNPILQYQTIQNEYLNAMINKIALTVVHNKTLLNPLRVLKKGTQPLGSDIEEIFTNMAQAEMIKRLARDDENLEVELIGLCTDICVVSNALVIKAFNPNIHISVDSACCAGVTPETHNSALETMKTCHVEVK